MKRLPLVAGHKQYVEHVASVRSSHCNVVAKDKVSVDDHPASAAVDPTVGAVYVASPVKGTVTVIRLQPKP